LLKFGKARPYGTTFKGARLRMENFGDIAPQTDQDVTGHLQLMEPFAVWALIKRPLLLLFFPDSQRLDEYGRRLDDLLALFPGGFLVVLPQQSKLPGREMLFAKRCRQTPGVLRYGARHGRQDPHRAPCRQSAVAHRGQDLLRE
jgi:hypothetical protein